MSIILQSADQAHLQVKKGNLMLDVSEPWEFSFTDSAPYLVRYANAGNRLGRGDFTFLAHIKRETYYLLYYIAQARWQAFVGGVNILKVVPVRLIVPATHLTPVVVSSFHIIAQSVQYPSMTDFARIGDHV